jgi:hypothetical protein
VLALVGEGATNRQIGLALFITPKTASVHVSRILAKLGWPAGARRPRSPTGSASTSHNPQSAREVMRSTTTVRPSTGVRDRPREPENILVRR